MQTNYRPTTIQALLGSLALATSLASIPNARAQPATGGWAKLPGAATDIASGWAIGTNPGSSGYGIWEFESTAWEPVGGSAVAITTDVEMPCPVGDLCLGTAATPWVINTDGVIYRWNGSGWLQFDDTKVWQSVAVGNPANPYEIWAVDVAGNIFVYSGTLSSRGAWIPIAGSATKVALFAETIGCGASVIHTPFVINGDNSIYKYVVGGSNNCATGAFHHVSGAAVDITANFVLGTDNAVFQWSSTAGAFEYFTGAPKGRTLMALGNSIADLSDGLFGIDTQNEIFLYLPSETPTALQ